MKKSIVLLISLLFISSLSILILKNLEDTNSYIKEQNSKLNKIQMIVLINNLQSEISKIFLKNQNSIKDFLSNNNEISFPLKIKDSELLFTIKEYDKVDVNLIAQKESKDESLQNLFNDYNISDLDGFKKVYESEETIYKIKDDVLIKNSKQLNDIITKYIKNTYNSDILNIKDKLGFISLVVDESLYEVYVKIKFFDEYSKAYYILNKEGEVRYFESSFK